MIESRNGGEVVEVGALDVNVHGAAVPRLLIQYGNQPVSVLAGLDDDTEIA